jgi:glutamyl-tRNA synthetase
MTESKQARVGTMPPRVRIAPSPTGDPHVGTAYIALFNYAFAKKHGGSFILRIEDTDQTRSTKSSEQAIYDALRWLGLDWDEGPDVGGDRGPYRQSERTAIYREHVQTLLDNGTAYRCFCTSERLAKMRAEQEANKQNPGYDGHCRGIDPAEAAKRAADGEAHVIRLKVPHEGETVLHDELRGEIRFANDQIDDQVLLKSDGFPTYHLANVVDDHLMGITHVIRGEDWITSGPKHVLLYQGFGWEPPLFFHLGLLRNQDKSKLSKRKNPVSVDHYRALGYQPATFLNFLATMGFSMGEDRERFSLQEMVEAFDWSHVSTGGPVFDPVKLDAFQGDDLRAMDPQALRDALVEHAFGTRLDTLVELSRERIHRLDDFIPYVSFFFGGEVDYTAVLPRMVPKKRTKKETIAVLKAYLEGIEKSDAGRAFTVEGIDTFSKAFAQEQGWKPKELYPLLRAASTGRMASPSLFETLAALGKDRVRLRLRGAIEALRKAPD